MKEWAAFLLPPAVALVGMRLTRLLLGTEFQAGYGIGVRFALGLAVGMLAFTQAVLGAALSGLNLARPLAWIALGWGLVELGVRIRPPLKKPGGVKIRKAHLWLLLLLPLGWYFWTLSRLSVVEGTMEFDAAVHWLMKSKILYLSAGHDFAQQMHNPNLAYVHWDYPLLVPALYTLNYGLAGSVDEFTNKVWPVWMVFALCLAILSLGNIWRRPHPLPIVVAILLCLLPATLQYVHWEGGTIPMAFYSCLTALLMVQAFIRKDATTLAAGLLLLAGGAMTKFEGILYAGFWVLVLLPVCQRQRWFGNIALRKAALFAVICVVPYIVFRLHGPIGHLESRWPQVAIHSPGPPLARFPAILGVGLARCLFQSEFVRWIETPDGRLEWIGAWQGLKPFVHDQFHLLPWLGLGLLGVSLWQRRHWQVLLGLTLVIFCVFASVAFVLACLPELFPPGNQAAYILSKTGEDMSRYYYPFFLAWFLGIISIWFQTETCPPARSTDAIQKKSRVK